MLQLGGVVFFWLSVAAWASRLPSLRRDGRQHQQNRVPYVAGTENSAKGSVLPSVGLDVLRLRRAHCDGVHFGVLLFSCIPAAYCLSALNGVLKRMKDWAGTYADLPGEWTSSNPAFSKGINPLELTMALLAHDECRRTCRVLPQQLLRLY